MQASIASIGPRPYILIAALLLIAACNRAPHKIGGDGGPIILISIDTLRSDRLPAYGYTAVQTPAIDALRTDSILYERAYSHCPLTLVSHASMFTGLLPAEHGARDNTGYEMKKDVKTVAEMLKSKGYATGGAVSAIVLRRETGIHRGFDFWDDDIGIDPNFLSMGRAQRNGDETRESAQKWIKTQKSKPFFFFFHIYEPHTPYESGGGYDGDVAAADAIIGRFTSFLKEEGLYESATIILLSDHGEGLGEHGEDEHGVLLYRETLQVPLMIKLPKSQRGGKTVSEPVQMIDLMPTIAAGLGVDGKYRGQSLLTDIPKDRHIYSETYYPRFHFGWSDLHSLISGNNHYIEAPTPELYDLAADPKELTNTLQENRRTYLALRTAIGPLMKAAEAPKAISDEQAQQLAALGYLGSAVTTAPGEKLPDPKEKIGSTGTIKKAMLAFQEKRYDEAVAQFAGLLRENPKMLDIWSMNATALQKLGRLDEAIASAQEGMKLSPSASSLAMLIANVALEKKDLDVAEKHANLIATDMPSESHSLKAQIWLARRDFAKATKEANAMLGATRDRPFALMLLGRIALEEQKLEEALRLFDEAAAINDAKKRPAIPKLSFFRGDTLARMGRVEEAADALRKEIAAYPADPQPYRNLILLYVAAGQNEAATELIFALEKAAPTPPGYMAISETLRVVGDVNGARFWAARGLGKYPSDPRLQKLRKG